MAIGRISSGAQDSITTTARHRTCVRWPVGLSIGVVVDRWTDELRGGEDSTMRASAKFLHLIVVNELRPIANTPRWTGHAFYTRSPWVWMCRGRLHCSRCISGRAEKTTPRSRGGCQVLGQHTERLGLPKTTPRHAMSLLM